jgi:hypothetical protein
MAISTKITQASNASVVDASAPYQQYAVVTYDGLTYQALQSEASNPAWDPSDAVTLWQMVPAGTLPPAPPAAATPAAWSATAT